MNVQINQQNKEQKMSLTMKFMENVNVIDHYNNDKHST